MTTATPTPISLAEGTITVHGKSDSPVMDRQPDYTIVAQYSAQYGGVLVRATVKKHAATMFVGDHEIRRDGVAVALQRAADAVTTHLRQYEPDAVFTAR